MVSEVQYSECVRIRDDPLAAPLLALLPSNPPHQQAAKAAELALQSILWGSQG